MSDIKLTTENYVKSVFAEGPSMANGLRLFLDRPDRISSLAYAINECIRPIMEQYAYGNIFATEGYDHLCWSFSEETEFDPTEKSFVGPVTIIFANNYQIPVKTLKNAFYHKLLTPGEYIEFITNPVKCTDM